MNRRLHKPQKASLDNFKPLLEERGRLYLEKKKIEDRIKELDAEIKPVLIGQGAVIHDGFQFEVAAVAGRTTYDYKAMQADGIDIAVYAKQGAPSSRFNIKPVQQL